MKGFVGKMALSVLVLLGLGAVSFVSVWLIHHRSDAGPGEHALVLPPLPHDHAAESLNEIGLPYNPWMGGVRSDDFRCENHDDLMGYLQDNGEVVTAFWDWYDQGGREALAPQTGAPNRARFALFDWRGSNSYPVLIEVELARLLRLQAYLEYQAGNHDMGRRALIASFELGRFLLQNADGYLAALGYSILDQSQFFLSEIAPVSEWDYDWSALLADHELLIQVWRKAGWFAAVGLHQEIANLSRDVKSNSPVLGFVFFSEGQTRYLIDHAQETFQQDIVGPIDQIDFDYFGVGKSLNPVGFNRYWLSSYYLVPGDMLVGHGLITARGDILRVRMALHKAGLPWQREHVVGQIQTAGLRNPFSGQPYQVEQGG